VKLAGFGTFSVRARAKGRNQTTDKEINITVSRSDPVKRVGLEARRKSIKSNA